MIKPIVKIIAPASPCPTDVFLKSLEKATKHFELIYHKNLIAPDTFFANKPAFQKDDLIEALKSDRYDYIWCLRGGWGSLQHLSELAKLIKPKKKKLLIGFSDITYLHTFINQNWQWKSLHAPNFSAIANMSDKKIQHLKEMILETESLPAFTQLKALNEKAQKITSLIGEIQGGNLTIIQTMLGTSFAPNYKNKILFIEDVGERGYRLDRCFTQMKLAGSFQGLKAIVLGDFTEGEEPDGSNRTSWAMQRLAASLNIPIYSGVKAGHGKNNLPILLGSKYSILCENKSFQLRPH
jgi:muramoyltetrapeptide carboxypeptidase